MLPSPAAIVATLAVVASIVACAPIPIPIVDMQGKDPVQTNRDMAECQVKAQSTVAFGNPIATCMKQKGYAVMGVH